MPSTLAPPHAQADIANEVAAHFQPDASASAHASRAAPAPGRRWRLARRCCLTPGQLLAGALVVPLAVCALSVVLWWHGYPLVSVFAVLQVVAVTAAVLRYGQHLGDGERVWIEGGCLHLHQQRGRELSSQHWPAHGVRILAPERDGGLIELVAGGRTRPIGVHCPPALRRKVAQDMKKALEAERLRG